MSYPQRATDEQIRSAYQATRSCKRAAAMLGICAQSVHERVVKLGIVRKLNVFTDGDEAFLRAEYERHASTGRLDELAARLGRTKNFICRQARALGLTDKGRLKPYLADGMPERVRAAQAKHGHPRGMLGKKHSAEVRQRMGEVLRLRWNEMTADERSALTLRQLKAKAARGGLVRARPETTWKAGWRVVGGRSIYFRSKWEANYARYLEWLRVGGHLFEWEHEPETFWFEKIKRGCRSYLPDFRVRENNGSVIYHEVKGWMDARSKTKIKRMAIYHPKVKLLVIEKKQYAEISRKVGALIEGWE
jgi:predicted DNA-binding protein